MREAGKRLARVHEQLGKEIKPGISTAELNNKAEECIRSYDCTPSFLHYQGYPASICASINQEVVHGIPSETKILQEGDIVSLDIGVSYKGYQSDAARTWPVGKITKDAEKLIQVTKESFFKGIAFAKAGHYLNEIGTAIQNYVESFGYSVIRDLVGHGIGQNMHEPPQIPNFHTKKKGVLLQPGMTLAIEPMVAMGAYDVVWAEDEWTVETEDGSLAAHYENTIVITKGEPEILSR